MTLQLIVSWRTTDTAAPGWARTFGVAKGPSHKVVWLQEEPLRAPEGALEALQVPHDLLVLMQGGIHVFQRGLERQQVILDVLERDQQLLRVGRGLAAQRRRRRAVTS